MSGRLMSILAELRPGEEMISITADNGYLTFIVDACRDGKQVSASAAVSLADIMTETAAADFAGTEAGQATQPEAEALLRYTLDSVRKAFE